MTIVNTRIKFPCGYEYEIIVKSGIWATYHFDFDENKLPVCPIHGKSCKGGK